MKKITGKLVKVFNKKIIFCSNKHFRDWRKNDFTFEDDRYYSGKIPSPYQPQWTLTTEEEVANSKLPVQERVLDFKKYMQHKGELKYSTGIYMRDIEPFPRLKIMMMCHVILDLLKEFDDSFLYKHISRENCIYIMQVVDENEVLVHIENALIFYENMENLIIKLDDEVTLLRAFLKDEAYKNTNLDDSGKITSSIFNILTTKDMAEETIHKKYEKPKREEYNF